MIDIPEPYGEWQDHTGGERPCSLQQAVQVRRRNNTVEGLLASTTCWTWQRAQDCTAADTMRNIVAWRTMPFEYVARQDTNLDYLRREAYQFSLNINPHNHAGQTVVEFVAASDGNDRWLSIEQCQEAIDHGLFVEGLVGALPGGGVIQILGTDMPSVVAECARVCRYIRNTGVD